MEKSNLTRLVKKLVGAKAHFPWNGQIDLTYRCALDCVHCYCKGKEDRKKELTTREWKKILDTLQAEGCVWLSITGGDPVLRDDFPEIYSYAKEKGFLITILTNGYSLTQKIIGLLERLPPFSVEITLNGRTSETYEAVTRVKGALPRVIRNIKALSKSKVNLILKSNCLKQNKDEIGSIKKWTEELLGKPAGNTFRFKYDPMIYPRLDGDTSPCDHRLSFKELVKLRKQDPDIWKEFQSGLHKTIPGPKRDGAYLYQCDPWMQQFTIDPAGRLKFCLFTDKFSVDLKTTSFKEGFYGVFPRLLNERFKTHSKCRDCSLRPVCYQCPARAYLEMGDEEAPVPYYCHLAEETAKEMAAKKKRGR